MRHVGIAVTAAISLVVGIGIGLQAQPIPTVEAQQQPVIVTDLCQYWHSADITFMAPHLTGGTTDGIMYLNTEGNVISLDFATGAMTENVTFTPHPSCIPGN